MLTGTIKQFNWLDIFVIILLLRICYIATKHGISIEFFKLAGVILAIYLSLHYYIILSDSLKIHLPFAKEKTAFKFLDFLSFLLLAIIGYFIFVLLRKVFYRLIKMEAVPNLNRWGGLVLGLARGILLVGLIVFSLVMSNISYLKKSVDNSYLGKPLFRVAPVTYSNLWNRLMSKFMTKEKFNEIIPAL